MTDTVRVQIFEDEDGEPLGIYGPDDKYAPTEEEQGFVDVPSDIVDEWRGAAAAYENAIDRLRQFVDSIEPEGAATKDDWAQRYLGEGNVTPEQYQARVDGCEHPVIVRYLFSTSEPVEAPDGRGYCSTCGKYIWPAKAEQA